MRTVFLISFALATSGCFVDAPTYFLPNDAAPDAPTACAPDTITCEGGHYIECSSTGAATVDLQCPLGCANGVAKCLDLDPSNGLAPALDSASNAPDVTLDAAATISTDAGVVMNGQTPIDVPTMVIGGIRVFVVHTLTASGSIKVTGAAPLAFVCASDATISGTLDVSADSYRAGPRGIDDAACNGGPISTSANPSSGGGGGGHGSAGGRGGAAGNGAGGGLLGAVLDDPTLIPLRGGCHGGGVSDTTHINSSTGGGGGGALQISSRTRILVSGMALIDASGGGALAHSSVGGSGGGAGGSILLEAPEIALMSGATISTKGGSGASAGDGSQSNNGSDGGLLSTPAPGGTANGLPTGGAGATATIAASAGFGGTTSTMDGAGGGGGVGRVRLNNTSGAVDTSLANLYSLYTEGTLATRMIP